MTRTDPLSVASLPIDLDQINQAQTQKAQKDPRYSNFIKWLTDNGAKFPRIDYPIAFGKAGLIGACAKEDIKHWEAFLFIPAKLLISQTSVAASPEIGHIIRTHSEIFQDHYDGEYLKLIVFIMYELNKGESSFWYPYFQVCNPSDLTFAWSLPQLAELQDQSLVTHSLTYRSQIKEEWKLIEKIFLIYPEFFPLDKFTEQLFLRAYMMVVSRSFGWSLPCTMMIPFADCLNHFTTDTQYEVYHKKLHQTKVSISSQGYKEGQQQKSSPEGVYVTKNKFKVSYKDLYDSQKQWQQVVDKNKDACMAGGEMRKKQRHIYEWVDDAKELVKSAHIWELPYEYTSDQEDNDTSDQEQQQDEEDEQQQGQGDQGKKIKDAFSVLKKELDRADKNAHLTPTQQDQKLRYDLIDKLIQKKASVFQKEEMKNIENAKQKITSYKQYKDEQDLDEEEEEDEQDFAWWKHDDQDMYFTMTTKSKSCFRKGTQVQIDLKSQKPLDKMADLLHFDKKVVEENKMIEDARKKLENQDSNQQIKQGAQTPSSLSGLQTEAQSTHESTESNKVQNLDSVVSYTKPIRLKRLNLSEQLFAYLRANLFNKYEGKNLSKIMISTPVCVDYELLVHACAIQLLTALYNSRFKTSVQDDMKKLKEPGLSSRMTLAIWYRIGQKEIVQQSIKLSKISIHILNEIKKDVPFKLAYMSKAPDIEENQDEFIANRIMLRRYLRQLAQNRLKLLGIKFK